MLQRIVIPAWLIVTALAVSHGRASVFGPDFIGHYVEASLGSPSGVPGPLGGLTFLAGDPNTLLIGGNANAPTGAIYAIGLVRDAGGHITNFTGSASWYASAPQIDGGLAYGPGGVLYFTQYNTNQIGQIKPGQTVPARTDGINGVGTTYSDSVGSLTFVPAGFAGAGGLKVLTYQGANFGSIPLSPHGDGTFDLGVGTTTANLGTPFNPEGMAYVKGSNYGFAVDSLLVSEYTSGKIAAYDLDGSGSPLPGTRRDFLTGLANVEGAFVDPLTGDFLFSTFNNGNTVTVIRGFNSEVPEAASLLIWSGLALAGAWARVRGWHRLSAA